GVGVAGVEAPRDTAEAPIRRGVHVDPAAEEEADAPGSVFAYDVVEAMAEVVERGGPRRGSERAVGAEHRHVESSRTVMHRRQRSALAARVARGQRMGDIA